MKTFKRWFNWLILRPWPAWAIFVLYLLHYKILIGMFSIDPKETTDLIALLVQIIGGIVVLLSLNSTINLFADKNIFGVFSQYLKDRPWTKGQAKVVPVGTAKEAVMALHSAPFDVPLDTQTIEEKVTILEKQIQILREETVYLESRLKRDVNQKVARINGEITTMSTSLSSMNSKVLSIFIDGLKPQLFGVLLMIYGSITNYLSA